MDGLSESESVSRWLRWLPVDGRSTPKLKRPPPFQKECGRFSFLQAVLDKVMNCLVFPPLERGARVFKLRLSRLRTSQQIDEGYDIQKVHLSISVGVGLKLKSTTGHHRNERRDV